MVLLVCGLVMEIRADLDHDLQSTWSQVLYVESSQLTDKPTVTCVLVGCHHHGSLWGKKSLFEFEMPTCGQNIELIEKPLMVYHSS